MMNRYVKSPRILPGSWQWLREKYFYSILLLCHCRKLLLSVDGNGFPPSELPVFSQIRNRAVWTIQAQGLSVTATCGSFSQQWGLYLLLKTDHRSISSFNFHYFFRRSYFPNWPQKEFMNLPTSQI